MGWLDSIKNKVRSAMKKVRDRRNEIKENKVILHRLPHSRLKKIAKDYGISTKGSCLEVKHKRVYNAFLGEYVENPTYYTKEVELSYEDLIDRLAKKLSKEQMDEIKKKLGIFKPIIRRNEDRDTIDEVHHRSERRKNENETIIDRLIREVQNYYPTKVAKKEETYEEGLYQWLLARFGFTKAEAMRQYQSFDIGIPYVGVVIEVKHKMNKSDRDRLLGQIIDGKAKGYYVIVAIYNTRNKNILNELVERLNKLNIKGIVIIDDSKVIYKA